MIQNRLYNEYCGYLKLSLLVRKHTMLIKFPQLIAKKKREVPINIYAIIETSAFVRQVLKTSLCVSERVFVPMYGFCTCLPK